MIKLHEIMLSLVFMGSYNLIMAMDFSKSTNSSNSKLLNIDSCTSISGENSPGSVERVSPVSPISPRRSCLKNYQSPRVVTSKTRIRTDEEVKASIDESKKNEKFNFGLVSDREKPTPWYRQHADILILGSIVASLSVYSAVANNKK